MTCSSCTNIVSRSLLALAGVEFVEVDLSSREATIDLSSNASVTAAELQWVVELEGFEAHVKSEICSQVRYTIFIAWSSLLVVCCLHSTCLFVNALCL
jgi:copper chaperone CopZ